MRSLEEKLSEVEKLFNRGSKSFQVAVDIVRKGRDITMEERALITEKIGCSPKTVGYVLTRLRKAGLYGSYDEPPTPQKPDKSKEKKEEKEEPPKPPKEEPEPKAKVEEEAEEPEEKYVTIEDFNQFVQEIKVVMGLNPVEEDAMDPDYVEEPFETPTPESVDLEAASMKQMGTWIEAKNLIYFDFARNKAFGGALEDFDGNWSDFVNIVIDDYFRSSCTRDGPCRYRLSVGLGLLSKRFA